MKVILIIILNLKLFEYESIKNGDLKFWSMKVNVNITLEFQIKIQKKGIKKYQYDLKNTGIRKFVYKI